MTLIESLNRTRELAGMGPLSEAQAAQLNEGVSYTKALKNLKAHLATKVGHAVKEIKGPEQGGGGKDYTDLEAAVKKGGAAKQTGREEIPAMDDGDGESAWDITYYEMDGKKFAQVFHQEGAAAEAQFFI